MRAVRIALVVSVALNLLVAGLFVGAWLDRGPERGPALRAVGPMAPFAAALEHEDRREMLETMRTNWRENRPGPGAFGERFAVMLDAIRAEPFDRTRLEAILAEQRGAAAERQETGERLLVDRIAAMTPAERAAYAERLADVFRRPPPRR